MRGMFSRRIQSVVATLVFALVLGVATASAGSAQARITSVDPVRLELTPGETATITLTGGLLNMLGQGSVRARGRPVRGVVVALQRSRSPLSRVVSLTVPAGTAPASDLELVFVAQNGASVSAPFALSIVSFTTGAATVAAPSSGSQTNSSRPSGTLASALPVVRSASPSSVTLHAGESEFIQLSGSNLSDLVSARLLRGGRPVSGVTTELLPSNDPTSRTLRLTAAARLDGQIPADATIELSAGTGSLTTLTAPVDVELSFAVTRANASEWLGAAVRSALSGATASFMSCGATAADRRYSLAVPQGGYASSGSFPRFDEGMNPIERLAFAESHSLDPLDGPSGLENLANTGHPSPVPHSITGVRMCLLPNTTPADWSLVNTLLGGTSGTIAISVPFTSPLDFRTRGMPGDPSGLVDGLAMGILWGDQLTDDELVDYRFDAVTVYVVVDVQVVNGQITLGTVDAFIGRSASDPLEPSFRGVQGAWLGTFIGPSGVRGELERFALARAESTANFIGTAFRSAQVRNAIEARIKTELSSRYGIDRVELITNEEIFYR